MTLREKRLKLFETWKSGGVPTVGGDFSVWFWQKRPYTAARAIVDGKTGYGFSKVMLPDKWDAVFGEELAVHKAIADAVGGGHVE